MTAADHSVNPEDLMAYLDGELSRAQAAVVQAHVAGCDGCQRSSAELRGVSRDLARWQVEEPPATLMPPRPSPGEQRQARSRFGWLLRPSGAYAAALSVLAVAAAVGYGLMSNLSMSIAPQTRQVAAAQAPPHAPSEPMPQSSRLRQETLMSPSPPAQALQHAGSAGAGVIAGRVSPEVVGAQATLGPSLARTASLRLSSRDFDGTRRAVERITGEMGGWFSHIDVSRNGEGRSLRAGLQFPAARLDAALAALKPLGIVLEESQKGEDLAEQIVDVDARLSNARNMEKRLVDLLQKRTGELEHVLAAEREIARVREEIERVDAHRKNLGRRVTFATLTLVVVEETQATISLGPRPVPGRFRDAFVTGVTEAMDAALGLALLVVRVAPSVLLWIAVLLWPVVMLVRWSQRRMSRES